MEAALSPGERSMYCWTILSRRWCSSGQFSSRSCGTPSCTGGWPCRVLGLGRRVYDEDIIYRTAARFSGFPLCLMGLRGNNGLSGPKLST